MSDPAPSPESDEEDDVKRKFREALERKQQAHNEGQGKGGRGFDAIVVVPPDHARIFREAGWSKARMRDEINALLTRPGLSRLRGTGGMDEGLPESLAEADIPKFREGGLHFVHAGGNAGMFSGILSSWVNPNAGGSTPVTVEVRR